MNHRLSYRAELFACQFAIQTLSLARPLWMVLKNKRLKKYLQDLPVWLSTLAASGICGMLAGFTLYCIVVLMR